MSYTTLAKKIGTAMRQRAQARDLSSMHAPVVWRACILIFLARVVANYSPVYKLVYRTNLRRHHRLVFMIITWSYIQGSI